MNKALRGVSPHRPWSTAPKRPTIWLDAREAHPRVRRVVVSEVPEPYTIAGIEVLPYPAFFERLPRWLR